MNDISDTIIISKCKEILAIIDSMGNDVTIDDHIRLLTILMHGTSEQYQKALKVKYRW